MPLPSGEWRWELNVFVRGVLARKRLVLVGDGSGWVLDGIVHKLAENVPGDLRPLVGTAAWRYARRCIIHFVDRPWAWRDGVLDPVHESNVMVATWWHGRFDTQDREMQSALRRLQQLAPRFARIQVPCSSAMETVLAMGVPREKVVVLPEGVDLGMLRPWGSERERAAIRCRLGIEPGRVVVGSFQKDGEGWGLGTSPKLIKGPDVLVEVLRRLTLRHRVHAVIPGPARGYVKERLEQAGIPVSAPGFVAREALVGYYHALDVYVSPSRDEGGPAGVLESMACGVPVVATKTGMAKDMVIDGGNGLLAGIDDVDGLVAAVERLAEDADLWQRVAAAGVETVRAYNWPVVAKRYGEELYRPLEALRRL